MRILIADDDEALRTLMRDILQHDLQCEVLEVSDGIQAWAKLQEMPMLNLCIFDMHMPQKNGLELLQMVRADPRLSRTRVMICSSINERAEVMRVISQGITYYLLKPFHMSEFILQVKKACGLVERDRSRINLLE